MTGRLLELMASAALVGIWVDREGVAHVARRETGGAPTETLTESFEPFAWARESAPPGSIKSEPLSGTGALSHLWHFTDPESYYEALRDRSYALDTVRPLEHQWLLARRKQLFDGLTFPELRRCQLTIEIAESKGDAEAGSGRVVAIGLLASHETTPRILRIAEESDAAERALLKAFGETLLELDPDVVEGHGIYNEVLSTLVLRARRYRVRRNWGRFGAEITVRKSRLRVAERWIDYVRCDLPGRTVFDTQLAVQIYDVSSRDMPDYSLGEASVYFGLESEDGEDRGLASDLQRIRGLADHLLPTYVAQAQSFPMLLQETCLRGTASKVDLLLLDRYFHARHALPIGSEVATFAGGFTKSYGTGVFRKVLHFDVASLYPSLLLQIARNPENDPLGAFIPTLENLRTYRLKYKQLARDEQDPRLRQEYQARQTSFKILINSFYGYLGFSGARFADGDLASEVTQKGRDLLQRLIAWFENAGYAVLEADTDGIYVTAPDHYEQPESLLANVREILPPGIDLELDGRYPAMFCYKAKNYALFDGETVTIRGSALRSRGIEPFLKELTDHLIHYLLGVESMSPEVLVERMAAAITEGEMPVARLAKSEFLSMSPSLYAAKMEKGGKPRRAALEVATRITPAPRMGERVTYYIRPGDNARAPDWQRAEPLSSYDAVERPYDRKYYLKKLREWAKRYGPFFD